MFQRFQQHIREQQLFDPQKPIIVGVSGGLDSIVLLDLLLQSGHHCIVAHANFHLRSHASDKDERFVRALAKNRKLTYEKTDFDTTQYAKKQKISIEMAARELRYEWFEKIAQKHQTNQISVAHHADDNIETLLLNLIRGTGLKGLTGIPTTNKHIIRPLLPFFRAELEQYALQQNLQHVTDHTNQENIYQRNKIRNQLLPLMEEINPSVKKTLLDNIQRFGDNANLYFDTIATIQKEITHTQAERTYIDLQKLHQQPHANTILYEMLKKKGFNADTVHDILTQREKKTGKQYYSSTHRLLHDRLHLILVPRTQAQPDSSYQLSENLPMSLTQPLHLDIRSYERTPLFSHSRDKNIVHLDSKKIDFPLFVRRWRHGDTFQPLGMKGNKKVSDFFIDQKTNRIDKENCWILCNRDQKIIWIIGSRIDDKYKITKNTTHILEVKTKQTDK